MRAAVIRWFAVSAVLAASAGATGAAPEPDMNDFAFSLYTELAKDHENVFFAPFSVSVALAMTAEGARGETAREMGDVLGLGAQLRRDDAARPYDFLPWHARLQQLTAALAPQPASPDLVARLATLRAELAAANAAIERNETFDREYYELGNTAKKLAAELNALQKKVDPTELRAANALWLERTFTLEQPFLDVIGRYYGTGGTRPVDFHGDPEAARATINDWVADRTNRRIEDLLAPGMIDRATRLVLTNAVYFLGEWLEPFETERTRAGTFRLGDGATAPAQLMQAVKEDGVRYAAFHADGTPFATPRETHIEQAVDDSTLYPTGGFQLVELPYRGGKLSMQVLLPMTTDGLPAVEKLLTAANLAKWNGALEARDVDVTLPKFRLEIGAELAPVLQRLGMRRAFVDTARPDGAQFDGMSASPDPSRRLYIGAVVHKAFVEVDEKGTEAAAATAVLMPVGSAVPMTMPFTPEFVADRPFVFLLRDSASGTILFLGRLARPT